MFAFLSTSSSWSWWRWLLTRWRHSWHHCCLCLLLRPACSPCQLTDWKSLPILLQKYWGHSELDGSLSKPHLQAGGNILHFFFLLNLIVTKLFQKWFAGKTVLNFKTRFVLVHCLAPSSSHTLNKERSFDSAAFVDMCRLVAIRSNYVNPFNSQLENQYQTKVNGILAISPDYYQVICSFHGWQQVQLVHSISVRAWTSSIYHFQLWGFPHLQWMPHTCMLFSLLWTLWLSFHRWLALTGSLPVEQLLWLTTSWGIALWARR